MKVIKLCFRYHILSSWFVHEQSGGLQDLYIVPSTNFLVLYSKLFMHLLIR